MTVDLILNLLNELNKSILYEPVASKIIISFIKGRPREKQNMAFINKWPLCRGKICNFIKGRLLKCGLYKQMAFM